MHWKVSYDKREAGRQENEMRKKDPLCRGQLWSWNDAWKNIILSLVSTQFVMSFTHSFNRLERMSHKTKSVCFSGPPCQVTNPNKWRNQSTSHNLPNSIEEFLVYLLSFFVQKFTDSLLWSLRSTFISPSSLFLIHFVWWKIFAHK